MVVQGTWQVVASAVAVPINLVAAVAVTWVAEGVARHSTMQSGGQRTYYRQALTLSE